MRGPDVYVDLKGQEIPLAALDADERKLVARLRRRARTHPDWDDFDHYWTRAVAAFSEARGVSRSDARHTAVYRIARDLSGRLAVAAGLARVPDYRDELAELIRQHFPTRRAFCAATGLSEDLLSHVLAHRKHLSLGTLTEALGRIGCALHITAGPQRKQTG
jgi:hypothetical protein